MTGGRSGPIGQEILILVTKISMKTIFISCVLFLVAATFAGQSRVSRHFPIVVDDVSYNVLLAYVEDEEKSKVQSHSPFVVVRSVAPSKEAKHPSIRFNRDDTFTLLLAEGEEMDLPSDLVLYYEESIGKFIILSSGVNLGEPPGIEQLLESIVAEIRSLRS